MKQIQIILREVEGSPVCEFVEIEDGGGRSISIGTWAKDIRGFQTITITDEDITRFGGPVVVL